MLGYCIRKYKHFMRRKTVSNGNARARSRARTRSKRRTTTRRRKGGECGDITAYEDNYHCVEAGCDKRECAKIYKASMPHKSTVSDVEQLANLMNQIELRKKNARTLRRTSKMNQPNLIVPGTGLDPAIDWRKYMALSDDDDK